MKLCVIVCAAGASTRFGSNKLDAQIHGRPVLQRTVELFTKHDRVDAIVVAGPHDDFDDFNDRYGDKLRLMGCTLCKGGVEHRWQTVQAALEHVPDDATHVAVHDGARCCTPVELLERLIEAIETPLEGGEERHAVIPGVPVPDTLKRVTDEADAPADDDPLDAILGDAGKPALASRRVLETVDRSSLVGVQTPQLFTVDLLRRAYEQGDLGSTDDAALVERLGETVHVIDGDARNLKITTPADLELARAIIRP